MDNVIIIFHVETIHLNTRVSHLSLGVNICRILWLCQIIAGLFPLLGHAAMNVRPSLLTVYETHFVPLGERLRPGLSGFLSGVLPGLEEGSDHFDR